MSWTFPVKFWRNKKSLEYSVGKITSIKGQMKWPYVWLEIFDLWFKICKRSFLYFWDYFWSFTLHFLCGTVYEIARDINHVFTMKIICGVKIISYILKATVPKHKNNLSGFISDVTVLLSLTVFLNQVSDSMPNTSDAVPLISMP